VKKKNKFLTGTSVAAATAAGTLFVAMLYAGGQAFRTGYLDEFGLYEALMPWTPQQLMFFGFQQSAYIDFQLLVGIGLYLGLIAALVALAEHLGRRAAAKSKSASLDTDGYLRSASDQKLSPFLTVSLVFMAAAGFVAVLWAFTSAEESQGRRFAKDERKAIDLLQCVGRVEPGIGYARISRAVGAGKPQTVEGYVVSCDAHACALYAGAHSAQQASLATLDNLVSFETWVPSARCIPSPSPAK